ncbi:polymer-forming cytoskeletal protein [Altererythrobacter sp. ZODW24]|uniref:bactofilin family protein n=1 Tax=Altererythrobacter sp. ZODW24 TaxID=2185142 RepID=UPI000DF75E0D|nr:polymer-forming cytoskeletal protein [Altererythrobacter sp. ZODW24]
MAKPSNNGSTFSVIGSDVTITGNISASADLHVDGRIEGDISCTSLVQGEGSEILGAISAESARLSGRVVGSTTARDLVVLKTAHVEGDVNYDALTIEQGAAVEGRFAPKKAPAAPVAATQKSAAKPPKDDGEEPHLTLAR